MFRIITNVFVCQSRVSFLCFGVFSLDLCVVSTSANNCLD